MAAEIVWDGFAAAHVTGAAAERPPILFYGVIGGLASLSTLLGYAIRRSRRRIEAVAGECEVNKQLFRDFAAASSDWLWETDAGHRFSHFYGKPPEGSRADPTDVLGRCAWQLADADPAQPPWQEFVTRLSAGLPFREFEFSYLTPEGERVHLSISGVPHRSESGSLLGYRGTARDITNRRLRQQVLREREQRLREMAANMPGVLFQVDFRPDGSQRVVFGIGGLRQTIGLALSMDDDGRPLRDFILAEDRADTEAVYARAAPALSNSVCRYRVRLPDGQIRWIESRGSPVKRDDGTVTFSGVALDVTERETASAALVASEAQFRTLVNESLQGVCLQEDGAVRFANPEMARMLGYDSAAELIGRRFDFFVAPEERERHAGYRRARLRGGEAPNRYEVAVVRKDGERRILQASASKIDWGSGSAILGAYFDVTERRQAEEALWQSEERFRVAMVNLSEGVLIAGEGGWIESFNKAAERIFGYSADEVIGMDVAALLAEADRQVYRERWAEHSRKQVGSGATTQAALVLGEAEPVSGLRRDGTTFPMRLGLSAVDLRDRRIVIATVIDLSVQRLLEDQLRQSQKMEAIGQLTGGIAHDFNNILAVVMGNLELLRSGTRYPDSDAEILTDAIDASRCGAELTSRLLTFARRQKLRSEPVDLNAMIGGMSDMLKRTLGETVTIAFKAEEGLRPALIDRTQLETAIINLAVNARDAMPGGGRLTIETRSFAAEGKIAPLYPNLHPGAYVALTVTDTGVGIPAADLDRVFEPFFSTKPVGKGTGLGLSMVFGFVKQSGGHVAICREEGAGTAVEILLPTAPKDAPPKGPATDGSGPATPFGNGERVLLVEDDPKVRDMAERLLRTLGYTVVAAGNGSEALSILERRDDIDLILTDVVLPDAVGGPEIAAYARAQRPEVAVVLTSGYPLHRTTGEGTVSAEPFIAKPFQKATLAAVLRSALHDNRRRSRTAC